ncbi:ABC transporter permease [Cumulibacter soli]|uniref:ABC transporter permease n=1 Tax=Cumulibacter soli TaxID=2546344 RepID=UPI00106754E9|nr:iron ABC transporter permease [Cumulibacter soli]
MRSRFIAFGIWAIAGIALVLYPTFGLVRLSFRQEDGSFGLGNYSQILAEPSLLIAAWNSLWTALATTGLCLVFAVPLAFLIARTDMPFKRLVRGASLMTFIIPNFVAVLGWILLLSPRTGLLNQPFQEWFGLDTGPINIMSPWGIVFCMAVVMFPLILLPTAAALDNIEVPLEHAAASLGAGRWTVFRKITVPLIMPAIYAGCILVFTVSFVAYGPAQLLGGPSRFDNIATAMLKLTTFPPRIEMAAVLGIPTIIVLGVLIYLQRVRFGGRSFSIISGKPGQRSLIRLGKWRIPAAILGLGVVAVTVVLPFGILLLTAFRETMGNPIGADNFTLTGNFESILGQQQIIDAFRNSFLLSLGAAVLAIAIAMLGAWLVERQKSRASLTIAPVMLLPLAFPGSVLGIALIIAYGAGFANLAGTLWILLIAYIVGNLPLAFTYLHAGLMQVDRSLEDAARSLGAGWLTTFRRVTMPLLRGPILVVGVLTFILQFRDLDSSIFLFNGQNNVIAVIIMSLAAASLYQEVAALSILLLVVSIAAMGVVPLLSWLGRVNARRAARATIGDVEDRVASERAPTSRKVDHASTSV